MKFTKTQEEVEIMKKAGAICANALKVVLENVKPGTTCQKLDEIARNQIYNQGAKSSFMTVDNYGWTICTTVNNQVVHGIPTDRELLDGDILGIDIGALYKGYHSDQAISVPVGQVSPEIQHFLDVGEKTLKNAIAKAQIGNHIGDISATIQQGIESAGFGVVKNLTGHGVGRQLHEDPIIPCFGKSGKGLVIENNMTLAIEVIYAQGSGEVVLEKDNWTIATKDGSLGGLFEQTIVAKENGPIIMTPFL